MYISHAKIRCPVKLGISDVKWFLLVLDKTVERYFLKYPLVTHRSEDRNSRQSMAQLVFCSRFHEAQAKILTWQAVFLFGVFESESVFKRIYGIKTILFYVVPGLKSPFPCWLLPEGYFQLPVLPALNLSLNTTNVVWILLPPFSLISPLCYSAISFWPRLLASSTALQCSCHYTWIILDNHSVFLVSKTHNSFHVFWKYLYKKYFVSIYNTFFSCLDTHFISYSSFISQYGLLMSKILFKILDI